MEGLALYHLERLQEAQAVLKGYESMDLSPWYAWNYTDFQAALAVVHAASDDPAQARELLAQIEHSGDHLSAGLARAALGDMDRAFAAFHLADRWGSCAVESFRYFFPDVLGLLRKESQYDELLRIIDKSWGLESDASGSAHPAGSML